MSLRGDLLCKAHPPPESVSKSLPKSGIRVEVILINLPVSDDFVFNVSQWLTGRRAVAPPLGDWSHVMR